MKKIQLLALALAGPLAMGAWAQKSSSDHIAEYRAMLADGNPSELFEAKGEGLWKQKRGPKNESLERCDLGKGVGVVKGVFVGLPRHPLAVASKPTSRHWPPGWRVSLAA